LISHNSSRNFFFITICYEKNYAMGRKLDAHSLDYCHIQKFVSVYLINIHHIQI